MRKAEAYTKEEEGGAGGGGGDTEFRNHAQKQRHRTTSTLTLSCFWHPHKESLQGDKTTIRNETKH